MAELKENQLIITDEEGNETLCEILFTFDSEEFNKSYVFFYEAGNYQEDDEVEVSFAAYEPKDGGIGELKEVENEEEFKMLSEVFNSFMQEGDECCGDCDCDDCEGCEDDEKEEHHCCCCHHDKKDDEDK